MSKEKAQKRAEELVKKWQADCQPMADQIDLQELENRIAKALRE